jgi:hypothetical protein
MGKWKNGKIGFSLKGKNPKNGFPNVSIFSWVSIF